MPSTNCFKIKMNSVGARTPDLADFREMVPHPVYSRVLSLSTQAMFLNGCKTEIDGLRARFKSCVLERAQFDITYDHCRYYDIAASVYHDNAVNQDYPYSKDIAGYPVCEVRAVMIRRPQNTNTDY